MTVAHKKCYNSTSSNLIGGGGVYADPAGIFLAENPIFQKKNAFLADFATGVFRLFVTPFDLV